MSTSNNFLSFESWKKEQDAKKKLIEKMGDNESCYLKFETQDNEQKVLLVEKSKMDDEFIYVTSTASKGINEQVTEQDFSEDTYVKLNFTDAIQGKVNVVKESKTETYSDSDIPAEFEFERDTGAFIVELPEEPSKEISLLGKGENDPLQERIDEVAMDQFEVELQIPPDQVDVQEGKVVYIAESVDEQAKKDKLKKIREKIEGRKGKDIFEKIAELKNINKEDAEKKISEADDEETEISSEKEFISYVKEVYKEAFSDEFDEDKAEQVANDLLEKSREEGWTWGQLVGVVQNSLG